MVLSHGTAIMPDMDDTPLDDLLSELEESDPADSPETADAIAAMLSELLDGEDGTGDGDEPETPS